MRAQGDQIIRAAAMELGLPWGADTTVFDTEDTNLLQLLAFANAEGQDLSRDFNWSSLQKKLTVTLLPEATSYPLPVDCLRMVPRTLWGKNVWLPGYGSPTAEQWESLANFQVATTLEYVFRIQGESLELAVTPKSSSMVTLVYQSSHWAGASGQPMAAEELAADAAETVFDRRLMVSAVKARYLEARGFDSTAARLDYNAALARAMGADGVAPMLRIGGSRFVLPPTLRNLPPTGWGQ